MSKSTGHLQIALPELSSTTDTIIFLLNYKEGAYTTGCRESTLNSVVSVLIKQSARQRVAKP